MLGPYMTVPDHTVIGDGRPGPFQPQKRPKKKEKGHKKKYIVSELSHTLIGASRISVKLGSEGPVRLK